MKSRRVAAPAGEAAAAARLLVLLRLLLVVLACAVFSLALRLGRDHLLGHEEVLQRIAWVLGAVAMVSAVLVVGTRWRPLRSPPALLLQVIFDLAWLGWLIWLSGGVVGPGAPLLCAVVVSAALVLPRLPPLLAGSLASLVLAASALLYMADRLPLGLPVGQVPDELINRYRILSALVAQAGALFLVDVLAQVLARRLREQRLLTDELLERLGEGVLVVDVRDRVLYANGELARLFDLPAPPAVGTPIAAWLAVPGLDGLHGLLAGDEPPSLGDLAVAGRRLAVRITPLCDRRGRRIGRVICVADETRLRDLEREAARHERLAALGGMAAGIAHEVRNPLAALRGCAQELSQIAAPCGEPARRLSGILVSEADRLGRIVDDFLRLSRLRPGEPRPVVLAPLFADITVLYRRRADLPAGLDLRLEAGCEVVVVDPDQIRQILLNLIDNAVDAVRGVADPAVAVTVRPPRSADEQLAGPALVLCVRDNGCGIRPEDRQRIFDPFFSTKAQGTGLGLSLVERLVDQHGGRFHLDSAAGRTEARVVLPAEPPR